MAKNRPGKNHFITSRVRTKNKKKCTSQEAALQVTHPTDDNVVPQVFTPIDGVVPLWKVPSPVLQDAISGRRVQG